jgi:hypothetical protein
MEKHETRGSSTHGHVEEVWKNMLSWAEQVVPHLQKKYVQSKFQGCICGLHSSAPIQNKRAKIPHCIEKGGKNVEAKRLYIKKLK